MIRQAVRKDVGELALLMGELGYPTTTEEMDERFLKISSNGFYQTKVAEREGIIIGMIGMMLGFHYEKNENYVRIVALVVDSKHRNQGIGGSLINKAEDWAKEQKAGKVVLNSGNRQERTEAHRFYKRRGFEDSATGYYKSLY